MVPHDCYPVSPHSQCRLSVGPRAHWRCFAFEHKQATTMNQMTETSMFGVIYNNKHKMVRVEEGIGIPPRCCCCCRLLILQGRQLSLDNGWQGKASFTLFKTVPLEVMEKVGNAHGPFQKLVRWMALLAACWSAKKANLTTEICGACRAFLKQSV